MGNVCCPKKKFKKKIVLLLVGLDNAGKTVAAKGLAGQPIDSVVPTVGFYSVTLHYKHFFVKVYDLGGGSNFRGIWHKYFVDAHGIIFVIDASDVDRLDEAKQVLEDVLSHEKIAGKPVLFLANKQDNENALDEIDLMEKIELEAMVNANRCPTLVECCAATEANSSTKMDPGIKKGYNWLLNYIERNYEGLNVRVQGDIAQQEILETRLRQETIERIKNIKKLQETTDEDVIELYSDYEKKMNGKPNSNCNNCNQQRNYKSSISGSSSSSSDSFPPVYHGTIKEEAWEDRPKSAKDLVKDQLKLNECAKTISKSRINQTLPVHLIGVKMPQSAKIRRDTTSTDGRNLKSAGDSSRMTTELPNMVFTGPSGDSFRNELFQLNNFDKVSHLPPLSLRPKYKTNNGLPWIPKSIDDGKVISVINID